MNNRGRHRHWFSNRLSGIIIPRVARLALQFSKIVFTVPTD